MSFSNSLKASGIIESIPSQSIINETNTSAVLSEYRHSEALDRITGNPLQLQTANQEDERSLEFIDPNAGPNFYEGVSRQQYDMINDFRNQVYIDPMNGMNNGLLEGYMAQFEKIQYLIKDQIIQYDQKTVRQGTWPYGVDITTTYDNDGNTIGKEWKHDNGYSAYADQDSNYTYKDSNGNEIGEDEYSEGSQSLGGYWDKWFGGQGDSNITAETDVHLGRFMHLAEKQLNNGAMLLDHNQDINFGVADNLFAAVQLF